MSSELCPAAAVSVSLLDGAAAKGLNQYNVVVSESFKKGMATMFAASFTSGNMHSPYSFPTRGCILSRLADRFAAMVGAHIPQRSGHRSSSCHIGAAHVCVVVPVPCISLPYLAKGACTDTLLRCCMSAMTPETSVIDSGP